MKIKVSDQMKKQANEEVKKLKAKEITKMSQAEKDALLLALCQMLGIADSSGKVK